MALLAGDRVRAGELARQARRAAEKELAAVRQTGGDVYYQLATIGEAALIDGDLTEAERWYREASAAGAGRVGELASTRRNARLIADATGAGAVLLGQLLAVPRVVVFSGHMIDRVGRAAAASARGGGRCGRGHRGAPQRAERRVRLRLCRQRGGHPLPRGHRTARGEVHVVLPYPEAEFAADSVLPAGPDWGERFNAVMTGAREVVRAAGERFARGGVLLEYANDLMLGLARMHGASLDSEVRGLVVWDGQEGEGPGGTAAAVADWRRRGLEIEIINPAEFTGGGPVQGRSLDAGRVASGPVARQEEVDARIMGVLFADVVNFSKLGDLQIPRFIEHFLGGVAALGRSADAPMISNTWGDGLYFVFPGVAEAGRWALELCEFVAGTDWAARGLPADLNLRVALHAGPLFRCVDPVTRQENFTGKQVVPAARLEPVTPPGLVYASQEFAALAATLGGTGFTCSPVGRLGLSKKAGVVPVYVVARAR